MNTEMGPFMAAEDNVLRMRRKREHPILLALIWLGFVTEAAGWQINTMYLKRTLYIPRQPKDWNMLFRQVFVQTLQVFKSFQMNTCP